MIVTTIVSHFILNRYVSHFLKVLIKCICIAENCYFGGKISHQLKYLQHYFISLQGGNVSGDLSFKSSDLHEIFLYKKMLSSYQGDE